MPYVHRPFDAVQTCCIKSALLQYSSRTDSDCIAHGLWPTSLQDFMHEARRQQIHLRVRCNCNVLRPICYSHLWGFLPHSGPPPSLGHGPSLKGRAFSLQRADLQVVLGRQPTDTCTLGHTDLHSMDSRRPFTRSSELPQHKDCLVPILATIAAICQFWHPVLPKRNLRWCGGVNRRLIVIRQITMSVTNSLKLTFVACTALSTEALWPSQRSAGGAAVNS